MDMIVPIFLGVLLLLGITAVILGRNVWRAHTITLAIFVLLAAVTFLYLAARTLKTHSEWRAEVNAFQTALAAAQQQHEELLMGTGAPDPLPAGDPTEPAADPAAEPAAEPAAGDGAAPDAANPDAANPDAPNPNVAADGAPPDADPSAAGAPSKSLAQLKADVYRALYGRGRVIERIRIDRVTETGLNVSVDQPDPLTVSPNSTFAVFEQRSIAERVPGRYLGEYSAAKVDAANRKMELASLNPGPKIVPPPSGELVAYEVTPQDSYEAYAGMDERRLDILFPKSLPPELKRQFVRHGQKADPKDPPDQVWFKIKFTKEHVIPLPPPPGGAAPAPAAPPAADPASPDAAADPAADPAAGDAPPAAPNELRFNVDDVAAFDAQTAQALIDGGKAQLVEKVYHRPLRDYPSALRETRRQTAQLNLAIASARQEQSDIDKSIALVKADIQHRQQQVAKLKFDFEHLQSDVAKILGLVKEIEKQRDAAQTQVSNARRSAASLGAELARLQLQAAAQIDKQFPSPDTAASR